MKVERSKVPVAGPVRATQRVERDSRAATGNGGRRIADTTAIMGIPEAELTPKVRSAIMTLMEEVASLREELARTKGRIQHLERLADQDSLLPVYNRRAFVRELTRAISITERYGSPSTVIYFDVDGMKSINDTLGHSAGDAALRHVADRLLESVRDSDVVGRLGGDEFGVILLQADAASAHTKAAHLAASIQEEPFVFNDDELPLTVTFGAYTFNGKEDASQALAAADQAMYARKREA